MLAMEVFPLDAGPDVAPYEQLRAQIASRAASGELPAGTRLPTVRALAADLGLAVNTVAKAYRALEADGVIATEGRRGTFVASTTAGVSVGARAAAEAYVAAARRLGLTLPEAIRLVQQGW
jgi:DNA-binding transcriptional regulator YhcF (GntR family)